MLSAPDFQNVQ